MQLWKKSFFPAPFRKVSDTVFAIFNFYNIRFGLFCQKNNYICKNREK